MRPRRGIATLLAVALLALPAAAKVVTDLDNPGGRLRYGVDGTSQAGVLHPPRDGRIVLLADLDGDGHDEVAIFTGRGVVAETMGASRLQAVWQVNVPIDLAWTRTEGQGRLPRFCDLGLAADIDNDGQEEIFLTIADPDRERWFLFVIDPASEDIVLEVELPLGPDRRADGHWDGEWTASGILPPGQASPNACVVLTTLVQYDAKPRGFTAIDLVSGAIVWRFEMAGNLTPRQRTWVGDLEGDGTREIVATSSAPDNLGGETIAGMSDDQSWLVVVVADGKLRRCVPLGGVSSEAAFHVVDLDGDGVQEILVATTGVGKGEKHTLRIFTPDLALLARTVTPGTCRGLSATPHADGSASIFLASDPGLLARYRYRAGKIDPPLEALSGGDVDLARHGDLLPEPGLELALLVGDEHRIVVVNEDLKPLLAVESPSERFWSLEFWTPEPGVTYMIPEAQNAYFKRVVPIPAPFPTRPLAALGGGLIVLATALVWRRRRPTAPPAARDDLARLLFDLELSGHGAMTVTRSLRDLQTMLSALRGGFAPGSGLRPHARRTFEDFAETDLLTMREILDRAAAARFQPAAVRDAGQALERLVAALGRVVAADLTGVAVDQMFPQFKSDTEALERGLQTLRREVEAQFTCDLSRVLEKVLWAREFDLEREGIAVQLPEAGDDPWLVLVDTKDLRFVLDNLVGNAVRAMAGAARRHLTIGLARDGGNISCRVSDTGRGVAEELRSRLFETRVTTREGGGCGLYRSKQLVSRWGGAIRLERTEPGRGSTFVVQLAAAGPRLRLVDRPGAATG